MRRTDYPAIGETLYTSKLPNGLPIFVVPKKGYRKSFACFVTNYGGADRRFTLAGEAKDTPAGVAHYLEHKMFDMPEGNALLALEAAGANANAFTSEAMTAYHFTCTQNFDENLRTLLRFVSTPYYTRQSVDKERGIIAQEIRMYEDDPDDQVYMGLMGQLFAHNPLRDDVAGTVWTIQDITPQVLYDCHKVFYHPSNMALCVVGDADPEAVELAAREILPPESAPLPVRDYGPAEGLEPVRARSERVMEVSAPIFLGGLKLGPAAMGPEAHRERITAGLALRCLYGRSSPAYLDLYGKGLLNATFGCGADYAAGQGFVTFGGESRDPDAAAGALMEAAETVAENGFDPALFDRQKKASYGGQLRALGDFRSLGVNLAEGCFAGYQVLDGFRILETVTCSDASAWVREHIVPDRTALSIIRPKEADVP